MSAKLLKLWANFDRQDVWVEFLRQGSSNDSNWIQRLTENELNFNEAVRLLCSYGLVDPDSSSHEQIGSTGYSIHSCVHSWTASVLNKEFDESLARLALSCVASMIPDKDDGEWWLLLRRLLQHAARYKTSVMDGKLIAKGMEWALHSLGDLHADQGKLGEVECCSNLMMKLA